MDRNNITCDFSRYLIIPIIWKIVCTTTMTKFGCTTCWKIKDDGNIRYWNDKPVCDRCYSKYERLDPKQQKYGYQF